MPGTFSLHRRLAIPTCITAHARLLPDTQNYGLCSVNAGNVFPPPRVSDPDMHHGTCAMHVPWCMSGSLSSGFLWSRWWGKRSQHARRMRNPQFCVSGKRPIEIMACICKSLMQLKTHALIGVKLKGNLGIIHNNIRSPLLTNNIDEHICCMIPIHIS